MARGSQSTPFDVLSAYRAELEARPGAGALGGEDDAWIVIGTLLSHAASGPTESGVSLFDAARGRLLEILGPSTWAAGSAIDPEPPTDPRALAPRMRVLCERIEDEGALLLADALLQSYLGSGDEVQPLERGRCDALRARFAWKRGDHDTAAQLYRRVLVRARQLESAELETRAVLGRAILARLRGNYPAARAESEKAVEVAEANGFTRLAGIGHHSLMIALVQLGRLDAALRHGWRSYAAVTNDVRAAAGHLADIAQLFADMGHYDIAAAGFRAALVRPLPYRLLLPALGGAALTAARLGEAAEVAGYGELARERGEASAHPYATAACWLEVARAYHLVGNRHRAEYFRRAVLEIASVHAYHELTHRAETLASSVRRADVQQLPLSRESVDIAQAVRSLAAAAL